MRPTVCTHWLPKQGAKPVEYQDAFWPKRRTRRARRPKAAGTPGPLCEQRFAVADGATQGPFSKLWARHLVRLYDNMLLPTTPVQRQQFTDALAGAAGAWQRQVLHHSLPWYTLEKVTRGAIATLAGLTLTAESPDAVQGAWYAFAVGDTCIAHIRNGQIQRWFPIDDPDRFSCYPQLLSSRPEVNERLWPGWTDFQFTGDWASGDHFLLMTDALACWFLRRVVQGDSPWPALLQSADRQAFVNLVRTERAGGRQHNDDVTLMVISLA